MLCANQRNRTTDPRAWRAPLMAGARAWLVAACSAAVTSGLLVSEARAQAALRIGPFDISPRLKLDAIYTSNVDGERESEAEREREDFYLVFGLDMVASAPISPHTILNLNSGIEIERHFVRDDLDTSQEPFGKLKLSSVTDLKRLKIRGEIGWESTTETAEDVVFTGGRSGTTRNPSTQYDYGLEVEWNGGPFRAAGSYEFNQVRFDKEAFKDGDKDETVVNYMAGWKVRDNLSLQYDVEHSYQEQINKSDDDPRWKTTENIKIDWRLTLLRRPELTYSFGFEREDTDEKSGQWEPKHELTARDKIQINSRLLFSANATYSYEENPEDEDIAFTYGAELVHDLSRSARQRFSVSREPKETFGSTTDSDSTDYTYEITKKDFLFAGLDAAAAASYEINKPVAGPEETIFSYELRLQNSVAVSRRLNRTASYTYSWEDSNLVDEFLDEHRVIWSYVYAF